jgi:tetratricopeptide (TPR) repeat protein
MARRTKARAAEHNQLGVTFFRSGAVDLAVKQFTIATKQAPWVPSYWLNLGIAQLEQGAPAQAKSALERALVLNPKSQSAVFHLAQLYERRGDQAASRSAYLKAIELDPSTNLARRARERVEGWRPRIIIEPCGADQDGKARE